MANQIIRLKRGLKVNLPLEGEEGQPYFTTDTDELYIGMGIGNSLKKIAKQEKIITFVYINADNGNIGPSIRFPYNGVIKSVNVNCDELSAIDSTIAIEKISKLDYINNTNNWIDIFSTDLTIKANQKIDDGTSVLLNDIVNKDDYFRINVKQYNGSKNIVVELTIELIDI